MDQPLIKCLDHLVVRTGQPQVLFELFTQKLGLPVAWQLRGNPFFLSGGVHLGNANLEFLSLTNSQEKSIAWLYGLVFELQPYDISLPALQERGLPHTPPLPFIQPDEHGWLVTTWSNVFLGGLAGGSFLQRMFFRLTHLMPRSLWERGSYPTWFNLRFSLPFLFDYVYRSAAVYSVKYNNAWYRENIQDSVGFPGLDVVGVSEVVLGARRPEAAARNWQNFLDPINEIQPMAWELPDGPVLRIVQAASDGLMGMTWRVRSLNRAAQFLHSQGLLRSESSKLVTLDLAAVHGLTIRLVV